MSEEQNYYCKKAISQEEYDLARADLKSAQAQSQLIRAQIKTAVRAPSLVE
jgi:membrane fusion protein (multidrug efflux system)